MLANRTIQAAASGLIYQIQRSLRLKSPPGGPFSYLSRTFPVSGNRQTWTFSVWMKRGPISNQSNIFGSYDIGQEYSNGVLGISYFDHELYFRNEARADGPGGYTFLSTTRLFRDPSAWCHIVLVADTTQATASDRVRIYVNGVRETSFTVASYPAQNALLGINYSLAPHAIGRRGQIDGGGGPYDGLLAEINFTDGQALGPENFAKQDPIHGEWVAKKYVGTYGTTGFYLNFNDPTNTTTLSADVSGNGNNWTPTNISLTAGSTYDSMLDVPLGGGGGERGNYCTLNGALTTVASSVMSNGNLSYTNGVAHAGVTGTIGITSGKWYWESTITIAQPGGLGFTANANSTSGYPTTGPWWAYDNLGTFNTINSAGTAIVGSAASKVAINQVWQIALDMDTGRAFFGINNVWYDTSNGTTSNPSTNTNPMWTGVPSTSPIFPYIEVAGMAQSANFGQRPFAYTPPTGFKALHTGNLPTPTIRKPNQYFDTTLYTGDGNTTKSVTNSALMQPDLVWIKNRSASSDHSLHDSVRGVTLRLRSNQSAAENTEALQSLDSGGFTVLAVGGVTNVNANNYVAWQWKAGGAAAANTSGTITSQVSANILAGFSIVTATMNGTTGTVGHGLGVVPKLILAKDRDTAVRWTVLHGNATKYGYLNEIFAFEATNANLRWGNNTVTVEPTSSVFTVGNSVDVNGSGKRFVFYCFAEIEGYSKIGSYTGNGSADGPFVYCGFRPRFVMWKRSDSTANWFILDTARSNSNVVNLEFYADQPNAEVTFTDCDILSQGFKLRTSDVSRNASGGTYIFIAFAEAPFKNSPAR